MFEAEAIVLAQKRERQMNRWELARYLIDAKKCIDSMLYITDNGASLPLDLRSRVNEIRRHFYVSLCVVLDNCFPKEKKKLCENKLVESIYYERDKNSAHKDANYKKKDYSSLECMTEDMKNQLLEAFNVCRAFLPQQVTLDFVSFDSELFRLIHGVTTRQKEEEIEKRKYPFRDLLSISEDDGIVKKIFHDTEDIRDIPENDRKEYATLIRCGICMEETIQRMQDDFIKTNVLFGQDMWVSLNDEMLNGWKRIREQGLVDEFDIPVMPQSNEELEKFIRILEADNKK